MKNSDIIIIGGGPAGSSAALYLVSYGFNVKIVEKKQFPRETLCGEFLSNEVAEHIKSLGLMEDFSALNPNKIKKFSLIDNGGVVATGNLGFTGYGIKRGIFDQFLLNAAVKGGAEIFEESEVKELKRRNNKFILDLVIKGEERELEADMVIGAWGKQNVLDKKLGRELINTRSKKNGVKFHIGYDCVNNFNEDEIRIYTGKGIYCGINKVNDNIVTVCFLEDRKLLNIPARRQIIELMGANKYFDNLFRKGFEGEISDLKLYGTGNIYFGKKEKYKDGIFFTGDAAGVIAPLAGDGIGMAMEGGKLVADMIKISIEHGLPLDETGKKYEKEWNKLFRKRLYIAKLIQGIILKRGFVKIAKVLIKAFPFTVKYLIKNTRE
jgi:menaquinone-9 beta-reductase